MARCREPIRRDDDRAPDRRADPPGREGWFRDNCRRGELADPDHFRRLTEEALGVPVTTVSFSEPRTDGGRLESPILSVVTGYRRDRAVVRSIPERLTTNSIRAAVGGHLVESRADTVDAALPTHLGSSIRVV